MAKTITRIVARYRHLNQRVGLYLGGLLLVVMAGGIGCSASKQGELQAKETSVITQLWQQNQGLAVPESVRFDPQRSVLYVSNIAGEPWGDDGVGYISKLSLGGEVLEDKWVQGLNCPKGMVIHEQQLYVTDCDDLVTIDLVTGAMIDRLALTTTGQVNDVSASPGGVIYATNSKEGIIYRIEAGRATAILQGRVKLNGVLWQPDGLYFADNGALYRLNDGRLNEGRVNEGQQNEERLEESRVTLIADGMEGVVDGIERLDEHRWLVSCWKGNLYLVSQGHAQKLLTNGTSAADLGYDSKNKVIYLPGFYDNTVTAYQLTIGDD